MNAIAGLRGGTNFDSNGGMQSMSSACERRARAPLDLMLLLASAVRCAGARAASTLCTLRRATPAMRVPGPALCTSHRERGTSKHAERARRPAAGGRGRQAKMRAITLKPGRTIRVLSPFSSQPMRRRRPTFRLPATQLGQGQHTGHASWTVPRRKPSGSRPLTLQPQASTCSPASLAARLSLLAAAGLPQRPVTPTLP